ncbi:MAG: hypothetical protein P8J32_03070 [bacterium]|nr:hypothetical protein [bacterium]
MNRFFSLVLALFVLAPTAFAQEVEEVEEIKVHCSERYPDRTTQEEAYNHCFYSNLAALHEWDINELQERFGTLEDDMDDLSEGVDDLDARVSALAAQPRQGAVSSQQPAPQAAPVYQQPSWYIARKSRVMSAHNLGAMGYPDTVHFTMLASQEARKKCGGVGSQYVVVTIGGVPMLPVVDDPTAPVGFVEVYLDETGPAGVPDGRPDPIDTNLDGVSDSTRTVWAMPLRDVRTHLWATRYAGDDVKVHYMVSQDPVVSGGQVYPLVRFPRRGDQSGNVVACGFDPNTRAGDNQVWEARHLLHIRG